MVLPTCNPAVMLHVSSQERLQHLISAVDCHTIQEASVCRLGGLKDVQVNIIQVICACKAGKCASTGGSSLLGAYDLDPCSSQTLLRCLAPCKSIGHASNNTCSKSALSKQCHIDHYYGIQTYGNQGSRGGSGFCLVLPLQGPAVASCMHCAKQIGMNCKMHI